ncbi:MAG: response regulator transcription factor [Erysipelotrichales bacterium]|nr:response regulator transcription factor [Erysipelotrichales bacterium]MBQ1386395.1 response regulator transcription factor [Erysipelotrichales bacterium]
MIKILIADDEEKIRTVVREYGRINGYEVYEAGDGEEAIRMTEEERFDLVILDIMMPNLDGFTACRQIKAKRDVPVIMLSARTEEYDKLLGFELGIDDYVTKPFSPKELMARIKVILERNKVHTGSVIRFEGLEVNEEAHVVKVDGREVRLTNKEYELLVFFLKNRNVALTRERILNEVWGYKFYGDERTVDTHVKMLRQSIDPYGEKIITVRGVGYKLHEG